MCLYCGFKGKATVALDIFAKLWYINFNIRIPKGVHDHEKSPCLPFCRIKRCGSSHLLWFETVQYVRKELFE